MTETAFPGGGPLDPNSYPGTDSELDRTGGAGRFAAERPAADSGRRLMRFRRAASG